MNLQKIFIKIKKKWFYILNPQLSFFGRFQMLYFLLFRIKKNVNLSLRNNVSCFFNASKPEDWATFEEVFIKNEYETNYKEVVVVDVGAHRGFYAAWAASLSAHAIYSYEPVKNNFNYLKQVSDASDGTKIFVSNCSVSENISDLVIHHYEGSWSHSAILRTEQIKVGEEKSKATTLNRIIKQVRTDFPTRKLILKIDCEGFEEKILLAASVDSLSEFSEAFVEFHGFMELDIHKIISHLENAGWCLHRGSYNPKLNNHSLAYFKCNPKT